MSAHFEEMDTDELELGEPTASSVLDRKMDAYLDKLGAKCRRLVVLTGTKFRREQPETSVFSVVTDDTHIIFYQAFTQYPLKMDFSVSIYPEKWAEAFLKFDLKSITVVLCEGVFTADELRERDLPGGGLRHEKKVAVTRAAKWMMNKDQDPWSYKGSGWPNPCELKQINEGFNTFNRVAVKEIFPYPEEHIADVELYLENLENIEVGLYLESITAESENNPASGNNGQQNQENLDDMQIPMTVEETNDFNANLIMKIRYPQVLAKAMVYATKGKLNWSSARMAKMLTKWVITQNEDCFFDAVQFSTGRLGKAVGCETIEEMAYVLFRKYCKLDLCHASYVSFDSLSAPKRLAIIRAVAWINKMKTEEGDFLDFDPSIKPHNLFLTSEEIERIRNYITYQINIEQNGTGSDNSGNFLPPTSYNRDYIKLASKVH